MKNHEGTRLGYNAQVVADSKHGLVVAAEVINEQNDLHQLVPMIDRVKEELGRVADETVADSGYSSGKQLFRAEKQEYPVIVSLDAAKARETGGDYDFSKFTYDKKRGNSLKNDSICALGYPGYQFLRRLRSKPLAIFYRPYRGCRCVLGMLSSLEVKILRPT